ncbi:hypothetical protein D6396_10200 [Salmonella enterica subsp. enterica serovar Agona]|nr:hypothetical protein [Salmonella enterica subsp. enterica serovar Agona]
MSDSLDQRPGNGRRRLQTEPVQVHIPELDYSTMSADDGIMAIKRANPQLSFAEAEEAYKGLNVVKEEPILQPPTFEEEPLPESLQTELTGQPVIAEVVERKEVVVEERKPEPVLVAEKTREEYVPPSPEPHAPAADHEPEATPAVKEKASTDRINFGDQTVHEEFSELEEDSEASVMASFGTLIGLCQDPNLVGNDLKKFFSSIPKSKDGRMLFKSEEQRDLYERLYRALNMSPPRLQNNLQAFDVALSRDDTAWEQRVQLPGMNKPVGLISTRLNQQTGAIAALRRRRKSGIPNWVWLPATGIFVGFRAPLEREICDFDIELALETAKIGMQTYGLMLSASSGVYLSHMIEFALRFVTDCSLDCEGNDMKTVLMDTIDIADYWLLLIGVMQAKFPGGLPWTLICGHEGCGHQEDVRLNLARCIRMGTSLYTDIQRNLWALQRGKDDATITRADQRKFVEEHIKDPSAIFEQDGIIVKFGRSTLGKFFDNTERWIEETNAATTSALAEKGTEREREDHLRLTAEARRLTRYAHMVESITVMEEIYDGEESHEEPIVEKDYDKIVQMLEELSSDRKYVANFEGAIATYNDRSRLAVFGYMGQRCPACGKADEGEKEGVYRGIVTISPDRVFFELSRVVFEIQRFMRDQFGVTG